MIGILFDPEICEDCLDGIDVRLGRRRFLSARLEGIQQLTAGGQWTDTAGANFQFELWRQLCDTRCGVEDLPEAVENEIAHPLQAAAGSALSQLTRGLEMGLVVKHHLPDLRDSGAFEGGAGDYARNPAMG